MDHTPLMSISTFGLLWLLAVPFCVTPSSLPDKMDSYSPGSNLRPIIGVIAQETSGDRAKRGDMYIMSYYVSYLEMAGARVLPILVNQTHDYYAHIMDCINGVLLPGGDVNLETSLYQKAAKTLYNLALKANDNGEYFPVWGTCLGFESLITLTAGEYLLSKCDAEDLQLPLQPIPGARHSRMLEGMSDETFDSLTLWNVTANFHTNCLLPEVFKKSQILNSFFRALSLNLDRNGTTFLSTVEAYKYPFYGTQWHPEKNPFVWDTKYHINNSLGAIKVAQHMANFFVDEARKNNHHFPSMHEESQALIYNYQHYYSGEPRFKLEYYFNYSHHAHWARGAPQHEDRASKLYHPHYFQPTVNPADFLHRSLDEGDYRIHYPLVLMGLGMVACLVVGFQIGRCMEAHNNSDQWPDVLQWMVSNSRRIRGTSKLRNSTNEAGPSGQRVKLLQHQNYFFTFQENTETDDENEV